MWCARLPITRTGSIVVLLPGLEDDHSPSLLAHGITSLKLPVPATSGGVTLAAWLVKSYYQ
ncbi:protein of unknown function [Pseudomonas putida KT2440]|uniref:Uncharacterized protein n=1 Tax=Pseudomonas putida (strain ATCC 47054 / DSM 6125 / CFBP 8728 / NCIMB 11950 / KT2440) TaxID=160488 RepID=A0A140FWA7_PSEPK|nr:protein of unknown function [Pseudomonas putida KT2440]